MVGAVKRGGVEEDVDGWGREEVEEDAAGRFQVWGIVVISPEGSNERLGLYTLLTNSKNFSNFRWSSTSSNSTYEPCTPRNTSHTGL